MLQVSTGFKSLILGPISFANIFAGGAIRVFSGARPTLANDPEPSSAFLIGEIRPAANAVGGLQFIMSGAYVTKTLSDVWRLKAQLAGTAKWWRLVGQGDTGEASLTAARIDGDVGTAEAPQEMVLAQTTFSPGEFCDLETFLYTIPPL